MQDQLADANWHPVFGPNFFRPAPRDPNLTSWGSEDDLAAFRCEGTSARLTRAPTFGSSTASDREWVHNVVNGYMNVSDEWLVYDGAESNSVARSKSMISDCSALINHDHECTAPSNLLPASPVINLGPAPAATGIEYTGPNPSAALEQRLDDHVDAPVARDESDLERASLRRAERHYLIVSSYHLLASLPRLTFITNSMLVVDFRTCCFHLRRWIDCCYYWSICVRC